MEGFKTSLGGFSGLQEGSRAANGDSRQFSALLKAGFTSGQSSAMKGCVGMQSGGVLHKLTFKNERREGRRGQHSERDCSLLMSILHQPPRQLHYCIKYELLFLSASFSWPFCLFCPHSVLLVQLLHRELYI